MISDVGYTCKECASEVRGLKLLLKGSSGGLDLYSGVCSECGRQKLLWQRDPEEKS